MENLVNILISVLCDTWRILKNKKNISKTHLFDTLFIDEFFQKTYSPD